MNPIDALKQYISLYPYMTPEHKRVFYIIVVVGLAAVGLLVWNIADTIHNIPDRAISLSTTTSKTVSPNVLPCGRKRRETARRFLESKAREFSAELGGIRVYFYHERMRGCNAHTDKRHSIGLNQHYARRLMKGDADGEMLCKMALFHELGHLLSYGKNDGYKFRSTNLKRNRFLYYIEEIYSDHICLQRGPVNDIAEWCRLKTSLFSVKELGRRGFTHPSWNDRFECLKMDFNEELIRTVADKM